MREMLTKNKECDRPKYEGAGGNTCEEERERGLVVSKRRVRFGEDCGKERELGIVSKVPPPTDGAWTLETAEAASVLRRKKNWSAPDPDKLVNFLWKRAHALHEGVAWSFEAITRSDHEYPSWFAEEKRTLIPKPRVHQ